MSDMLSIIKQQLRLRLDEIALAAGLEVGGFVVGFIMMYVIMNFADADSTFPLATIFAIMMGIISTVLFGIVSFQIHFNNAVSMQIARKRFAISYLITAFIQMLVVVIMVIILGYIDKGLAGVLYPNIEQEFDIVTIFRGPYIVLITIGSVILQMFLGAVNLRFGKKAFWVLWVIWMSMCFLPQRIADAVENNSNSVFGNIGRGFVNITSKYGAGMWMNLAIVCLIIMSVITVVIIRKQSVTI